MPATKTKQKSQGYGVTLGIYFGDNETEEYHMILQEAETYRMKPSEYARRLLRAGRKAVKKDPAVLLNS